MRYERFLTKFKEASEFVASSDVDVKDPQALATAMVIHCGSNDMIIANFGEDGERVIEFCSTERREKEILANFKDLKPRRVKYMVMKFVESGRLKKTGWGKVIKS